MQTIGDIMTRDVKSCIVEDNIYEAAVKMKSWDIGAVPVVSNDQLVGIVTDRDLVVRAMAEKKPNSTQITEIMTHELITATPDMNVEEAADIMSSNQIRRLPVVEGSKLIGIVALRDLAIRNVYDSQAGEALTDISKERDGNHPTSH